MNLFKKIKNKLGMLALFGLLFQLTMPVYQTYVFANENGIGQTEHQLDDENNEALKNENQTDEKFITGESEFPEETEEEKNKEQLENIKGKTEDIESVSTESVPEELPIESEVKREPQKIAENIITDMRLMYKDGTIFEDDDLIEVDEDLRLELDWSLLNNQGYMSGDYFEFKLPRQLTVYNKLDGLLGDYGSYTVDMDGHVKFTFNEKIEQESKINGTFWMETELNEKEITTTEETIELVVNGDTVQKIIVNIKPTGGQAISKSGQPVGGNFNTEEVEWTVIVNTTRESLKNAVIDDVILVGQELILDSLVLKEVKVDLSGKMIDELDEITDFTNNSTVEKLNIQLGDTNKAYKLTFKTKLLEKDFKEGTTKYENTAVLKSAGKDDAQAGGSVSVSRPKSMEKTSSAFDKENRWIEWTVNANFTEQHLKKDDVITDEFTFTVDGNVVNDVFEIKEENIVIEQVEKFDAQGKVTETSDAKDLFDISIVGNKVTYKLKEDTNKAFVLKYKTTLKDGAYIHKDGKITNKVELNGKTTTGSQGVYQQVGKKINAGINYEDKTIDWTIIINADKQDLRNFVLTDNFAGSGQTLVAESIKITPANSGATITPNADAEGFKINFGDIKEAYTITYQTKFTYDFEGEKTPNFKNGVKITYETRDDSDYEFEFGNTIKPNEETKSNGAKNGSVNNETKEITWAIDINYNQLSLTDAKLTDAIPDNQMLIGDVQIYETSIEENGRIKVGDEVTEGFTIGTDDNEVNVTFNGKIDKSYRIVFNTKDKDGIYQSDEKYTNTAQFIPREGEVHNLTATVTLPNQGEFIGKTGTHNKENWTADWTIDVNKSLSKIENTTVTDVLGKGQILLKETIKVTKAGVNEELEEGKDYELTVDGNEFEIYFPREITEAYVITYSSYIIAEKDVDITNKAKINSNDIREETIDKSEKIEVRISTGGGTGEGTTGGLVIEKFEAGSDRALKDVAFSLVKTIGNKEIVVREGTTNANGKLEWNGLQYGNYTLKETIPNGYLGESERTVTISSKDPEGIKILPIENIRQTGKIKIIKVDAHTGEALKDAKFKITNQTTGQKYEFETDKDGVISKEVPFGEYTVEEIIAPEGYRITTGIKNITVEIGKTAIVEVKNVAYVDVKGQKTWFADQDKELPESIIVQLLANDKVIDKKTVTKDNDWKYSFDNLDKYDGEKGKINYTIKEVPIEGYTVKKTKVTRGDHIHELNLTNIETMDISGIKTWQDDDDATKKRPKSITVELIGKVQKDEVQTEVVKTYTTTASRTTRWKYEFKNIPKYTVDGKKITYEVKEAVEGYKTTYDGFNITNIRANDLKINGEKIWKDANAGSRPSEIIIELTRQLKGVAEAEVIDTKTVKPDENGKWFYDFGTVPQFNEDGVEYMYSVREKEVPAGYKSSVNGYNITNIRVGSINVSGIKHWKDDSADARPNSITVNLLRNGEIVQSKKVTATDNWAYAFTNLPTYDANGQFYNYRISEEKVPGYVSTVVGNDIINTRSEKTAINITKSWLDNNAINRPTSIAVNVYQNEKLYDTVTLTAADAWAYELTNLEKFDEDGQAYTYTIEEEKIEGYEAFVEGYQITNLRVGTTEVNVLKNWVNDEKEHRPKTIEVDLFQNGKVIKTVQLSEEMDWKYTFTDLEEFDSEGKVYEYTVKEKPIKGYRVSLIETDTGFEITNTLLRFGEVEDAEKPYDPTENQDQSKPTKPGKGEVEGAKKPEDGVGGSYAPDGTWLPKTGETNNTGLYLIGGLFIFVGLVLGKKRIKE